jgi:hypothetical protein
MFKVTSISKAEQEYIKTMAELGVTKHKKSSDTLIQEILSQSTLAYSSTHHFFEQDHDTSNLVTQLLKVLRENMLTTELRYQTIANKNESEPI